MASSNWKYQLLPVQYLRKERKGGREGGREGWKRCRPYLSVADRNCTMASPKCSKVTLVHNELEGAS